MPWVKIGGRKKWVSARKGLARRAARMRLRRKLRRGPSSGFLVVKRKCPKQAIQSTATAGAPNAPASGSGIDMIQLGTPVLSNGTVGNYYDVPFSFRFRFNQINNPGEFSALFDQYKIKGIKLVLQLNNNTVLNSTTAVPAGYQTYIEYVPDYDDAVPLTVSAFEEKMGIRTKYFNRAASTCTMSVAPRCANEIEGFPAGSTAFSIAKRNTWVNMAYTGVPHYGIKGVIRRMYLPAGASVTSINVDSTMTFHVKDIQ